MKPHRLRVEPACYRAGRCLAAGLFAAKLHPGEQVELWNLWVGDARVRAFRLAGPLADLDADALTQLEEQDQTCITLAV